MAQLMDRDMSENLRKEEFKDEGSKKSLACVKNANNPQQT